MDQVDEISLLDRLFALRDAKQTAMAADVRFQSTRVYGDAGHVNSEINALFRGRPLIAGLAADLPQCGDHMTVELGSVSVIVVRSENASVRAFLNACRHRGSRLAEGRLSLIHI